MIDGKFYGMCLVRVELQLRLAQERILKGRERDRDRVLLESYCSADPEEVCDILEIYDLENMDEVSLFEKLEELADTVSILTRSRLSFGYSKEGHIGLFASLTPVTQAGSEAGPVEVAAARA